MTDMRALGYLIHLGSNMWRDTPLAGAAPDATDHVLMRCCADYNRCDDAVWRRLTDHAAARGFNMLVIDLGEGMQYPSRPELAVKGSWTPDKLRKELARLRSIGLEPIPKLNFSATHDTWLGEYHRMVSTPEYYRVCEDVLRDAYELFDHPRLFHIGYDEETAWHQQWHRYSVVRSGELWWHDFLKIESFVEKLGTRPWIWSDKIWHHEAEFLKRMPKTVLQSNWYYDAEFTEEELEKAKASEERKAYVKAYRTLEKAGYDQLPAASNWGCDINFEKTVRYCRKWIAPERLKGFMTAPWWLTEKKKEAKCLAAIDLAAAAMEKERLGLL